MVPVSVVVPCFRCATTIRRAVESVANQTMRPREVILVDDGSGDDTLRELQTLSTEFGADWLRVIELRENCGTAAARNVGWDAAHGDYVAFLDADDAWLPEKIEHQWRFMEAHRNFVLTGHRAIYRKTRRASNNTQGRLVSRLWVLLQNPMVTPSFMVRRTIATRFDAACRHMEDHRLLQELVFSGQPVARLEEPLVVISKPAYGAGGLSGHLWAMEKAELANYRELRRRGRIGALAFALLLVYSLLKFARRLGVVALRRLAS